MLFGALALLSAPCLAKEEYIIFHGVNGDGMKNLDIDKNDALDMFKKIYGDPEYADDCFVSMLNGDTYLFMIFNSYWCGMIGNCSPYVVGKEKGGLSLADEPFAELICDRDYALNQLACFKRREKYIFYKLHEKEFLNLGLGREETLGIFQAKDQDFSHIDHYRVASPYDTRYLFLIYEPKCEANDCPAVAVKKEDNGEALSIEGAVSLFCLPGDRLRCVEVESSE